MKIALNLSSAVRRLLVVAAMSPLPVITADQVNAQTATSPKITTGSKPAATIGHKCSECGCALTSGAVCEKCSAIHGVASAANARVAVGTGDKKMMMASNNMMMQGASFVYTLDNDLQRNSIAVYRRGADGSLMPLVGSPFNAGGKGLGGGDIDEQGAIRMHGHHVLAVNPGSDTIAVLEKTNRGLLHVEGSPFPSGGSTPLSLAVHGDMVYVANQAAEFAHPTSEPNITGFRITSAGRLMPLPNSTAKLPKGMGPAQVEFTPDGQTLVVTAGFQADEGNGSRIYTYKVEKDGRLMMGPGSPIKPEGATGTVGFSINPQGNKVFVSTFKGSGVVPFDLDSATASIKQAGMPASNDQRAACWTVISRDGSALYVGNFVSNSISVYDVAADGKLTLLGSVPRRGATNKDTKDIELSRDGKFLYAVGSGERQISIFRVESNRLLTELPAGQSPVMLATGQNITGLLSD